MHCWTRGCARKGRPSSGASRPIRVDMGFSTNDCGVSQSHEQQVTSSTISTRYRLLWGGVPRKTADRMCAFSCHAGHARGAAQRFCTQALCLTTLRWHINFFSEANRRGGGVWWATVRVDTGIRVCLSRCRTTIVSLSRRPAHTPGVDWDDAWRGLTPMTLTVSHW